MEGDDDIDEVGSLVCDVKDDGQSSSSSSLLTSHNEITNKIYLKNKFLPFVKQCKKEANGWHI